MTANSRQNAGKKAVSLFPESPELESVIQEAKEEVLATLCMNRIRSGEEMTFPGNVVARIIVGGEPPLKVFREWRGLDREELAEKARVDLQRLATLEDMGLEPDTDERNALSRALNIPADLLIPS